MALRHWTLVQLLDRTRADGETNLIRDADSDIVGVRFGGPHPVPIREGSKTMKTIHHLCQGGSAAAMLRAALSEPVIDILDDTAIGPLVDVDTDQPDARVRFMQTLFACGGFDPREHDAMDWYGELRDMNHRLASLAASASEVVIWAGPGDTEQALRRRAHWWLKDASVTVSEVDVSLREMANGSAALVDLAGKRVRTDAALRVRLASEWETIRQDGDAVRVVENDALRSCPIDHYDAGFAALLGAEPVKLMSSNVLGRAMSESGRSDLFCKWRFSVLIEQGKIVVTQGDVTQWESVWAVGG
jgi:hypothetical protein